MTAVDDTICAISTAMSDAGIGIIRVSGPEAVQIADGVFFGAKKLSEAASHTIHHGYIRRPSADGMTEGSAPLDEVLVSVMRAPHSYTREDVVEINCHGGRMVLQQVLELLTERGCRLAEPGEFTKRAFLNGRLDLSEAEAVMDIISSQNDFALSNAQRQLSGALADRIGELRSILLEESARIEAALDDPDAYGEDGPDAYRAANTGDDPNSYRTIDTVDDYSALQPANSGSDAGTATASHKVPSAHSELESRIIYVRDSISALLASADEGHIRMDGIDTIILGRPNAGKSSLMNRLAGTDRAIVTEIPGTTRDLIEERIVLGDLVLNIIDTAGLRTAEDEIERIGVERAIERASQAELILYVIDGTDISSAKLPQLPAELFRKRWIVLCNKADLWPMRVLSMDDITASFESVGVPANHLRVIETSMLRGTGLERLKQAIISLFLHGEIAPRQEYYVTGARQKQALRRAASSIELLLESIRRGVSEDLYLIDMMDAYRCLGEITGEGVGDDLIDEIFSRFCMGK